MDIWLAPLNLTEFLFWLSYMLEEAKSVISMLKTFFSLYPQFFIICISIGFAFGFIAWLIKSIKF